MRAVNEPLVDNIMIGGVCRLLRPRSHGQCSFVTETLAMSLCSHTAKITLYYLARSPLSQIFAIQLNFHEHIFSATNLLCQRKKCPLKRDEA